MAKNTMNNNKQRRTGIQLTAFLTGIITIALGTSAEIVDPTKHISIDGTQYETKILWTAHDYLHTWNLQQSSQRSDFFVHNDIIYVNFISYGQSILHRVDATNGNTVGDIAIEWNVEHTPSAASFVNIDSKGNPYIASRGTADIDGYPFEIYPLDFNGDIPVVNTKFTLPLVKSLWPRDPIIDGDISTGTFTVTATAWYGESPLRHTPDYTDTTGAIMIWQIKNGICSSNPNVINAKVSDCTIIPVENKKYIFYDRGFYDNTEDYDFKIPSLVSIADDNSLTAESQFDGTVDNAYGAGAAIAAIAGKYFIFYGRSYQPTHYAISHLPNYPANLENSTPVNTYPASILSLGNERRASLAVPNKGQVVHAVTINNNTTNFYTMTNNNCLACVQVTSPNTGVIETINAQTDQTEEYYTVDGIKLSKAPTVPGIYIHHSKTQNTKLYIR